MMITRRPQPPLRPFVKTLWAMDQSDVTVASSVARERVLPTGEMHLAIRISSHPLRVFEGIDDQLGQIIGFAVVGGVRWTSYMRDISAPTISVGAQLLPGASELLFGAAADELAGQHTLLDDVWGPMAARLRERLFEAGSLEERLNILEADLNSRLPRVRGLHPAVAHALDCFNTTTDIGEVVRQTGYSHRRFIALFSRSVGLRPKLYCRVQRFQRVLEQTRREPSASLADLALTEGYSDQPHFSRQFREFSGVTPREYQKLAPLFPNHLPVLEPKR